jgi:hypothetical protein
MLWQDRAGPPNSGYFCVFLPGTLGLSNLIFNFSVHKSKVFLWPGEAFYEQNKFSEKYSELFLRFKTKVSSRSHLSNMT